MTEFNNYGQPVGPSVLDWTARSLPKRIRLPGRYCQLVPLDADKHAAQLHSAYTTATDWRDWTYLFAGPFQEQSDYIAFARQSAASEDPLHYAVIDLRTGNAIGTLSLMRHDPAHGVIEVGNVIFSPLLKQSALSTEAHYLLMSYVFDQLGYRRYEWKCDSLNEPSVRAAKRLGFKFEGIFRQAVVYKGRNRDTAWFSIIDHEWPLEKQVLEQWLLPDNFDNCGRQVLSLRQIREQLARVNER